MITSSPRRQASSMKPSSSTRVKNCLVEVDDPGAAVADEEAVDERHLCWRAAEAGLGGHVRPIVGERALARIEVEGLDLAAILAQEISDQAGQKSLAGAGARRRDDEDRRPASHPRRRGSRSN